MEEKYRIVIENESKKIEVESTNKEWLEKQKKELIKALNIYSVTKTIESRKIGGKKTTREGKPDLSKMTINEFYRMYCAGLKSNPDRAVFFIYYLNWVEKKKDIGTNEVKELFLKVGIPKANDLNYADILSRAKKRALLNSIENNWSLTITGEDYVLNKIQSDDI